LPHLNCSQIWHIQKTLFRYLQARDWAPKKTKSFLLWTEQHPIDAILSTVISHKGIVSRLYEELSHLEIPSLDRVKEAWQKDLKVIFSEDEWLSILSRVNSSSVCARHGLFQFKVVHRLHLSKSRLSKIYPLVDASCNRCWHSQPTFVHAFQFCPKLSRLWGSISSVFTKIFGKPIDPNPLTALFAIHPWDKPLTNNQSKCIVYSTVLARRLILLNWNPNI